MNKYKNIAWGVFLFVGLLSCIEDKELDENIQNASKPLIGSAVIDSRTASTVTLTASIDKANGSSVTERGFCWSTSSNPTVEANQSASFGSGLGEYSGTIENLSGNTTYYIRPYAKNGVGIAYGEESSVSTNTGLGSVRTFVVSDSIRATSASCGGKIELHGEGSIIRRGIYYSISPTMSVKDSATSIMNTDSFTCILTGLSSSTTYYVRAFVTNTFGTYIGAVQTFKTNDGRPSVSVPTTLTIGYTNASFLATVLDEGDAAVTERGFCWSTTTRDPTILISKYEPCGNGSGVFSATCAPLEPQHKYYVRSFAKNVFGISYSAVDSFWTRSDVPSVTTAEVTNISGGSITYGGQIESEGKSAVTQCGICWSTSVSTPDISNGTKVEITPNVSGKFIASLSGLKGGTVYYIRAYATNAEGTSYGTTKVITTPQIFNGGLPQFEGTARIQGSPSYFSIGNKGYLLGGDIGPQYSAELWNYDASMDKWRQLQPHPKGGAKWQTAVVRGSYVFILGGMGAGYEAKNDFYQYNSSSNMWYVKPTGPDSSYLSVGCAIGENVCFIGGRKDTAKNDVWAFNVDANTWTRMPDFPVKQFGGVAATIGSNVYAGMGKNTSNVFNKKIWKSTSTLSSWTEESVCTMASGGILAGVAFKNKLYVIDEAYNILEYDPATNDWVKKSQLASEFQSVHCMFALNNLIYIGLSSSSMTLISYDPSWDN